MAETHIWVLNIDADSSVDSTTQILFLTHQRRATTTCLGLSSCHTRSSQVSSQSRL